MVEEIVGNEYRNYNWFNVMEVCKDAIDGGVGEGFFLVGKEIHKIEIIEDKVDYEVFINDVPMGPVTDLSEMWDTIDNVFGA